MTREVATYPSEDRIYSYINTWRDNVSLVRLLLRRAEGLNVQCRVKNKVVVMYLARVTSWRVSATWNSAETAATPRSCQYANFTIKYDPVSYEMSCQTFHTTTPAQIRDNWFITELQIFFINNNANISFSRIFTTLDIPPHTLEQLKSNIRPSSSLNYYQHLYQWKLYQGSLTSSRNMPLGTKGKFRFEIKIINQKMLLKIKSCKLIWVQRCRDNKINGHIWVLDTIIVVETQSRATSSCGKA